jgi:hypothetical protein
MRLRTLPLHVRRRLIQHEDDVLTPAVQAQAQKYSSACPRCGGAMHLGLAEKPFRGGILPANEARCVDCGCVIDALSGMMVKMGNPAKVEEALPIIDPKKE